MSGTANKIKTVSHIGLCVSDLDRSVRFYCEGLGFRRTGGYTVGNEVRTIMELEGEVVLTTAMLQREGLILELLGYTSPKAFGEPVRRPLNQLGFTHLSLWVEDLDAVANRIREFGGQVIEHTRTTMQAGDFIYCTDPDGIRVELMRLDYTPDYLNA
jgi:lactoylglutathione lyase